MSVLVIGLTGNIGAGKSTVLGLLKEHGADIIDADQLVRQLQEPGQPVWRAIVNTWGKDFLLPDEHLDRKRLGQVVFADAHQLARLEAIVHPAVFERIKHRIDQSTAPVVVIEAIKLLEAGMTIGLCDEVWVVTASPEQQKARLLRSRAMTEEQIRQRLNAQTPQAAKVNQANVVIDNSGTLEQTRAQVDAAWAKLFQEQR